MSQTLGGLTLDHISSAYQSRRHASEFLARAAAVTPATAINWLRKRCAPQADNIGELIKNDPEFRAKVVDWINGIEKPDADS